tara:strand:+ start:496 stop:603 length:108 start_codon:yes stop_codon:yes gene_type:complete
MRLEYLDLPLAQFLLPGIDSLGGKRLADQVMLFAG